MKNQNVQIDQYRYKKMSIIGLLLCFNVACEKGDRSISFLGSTDGFKQTAIIEPRKIDILWVIDNSGSMQSSQTQLTNNFNSFINRFQSLNFDFHMAVTTSDAWVTGGCKTADQRLRLADGKMDFSIDGNCTLLNQTSSGVRIMSKSTPNLNSVYVTNATQGIYGSGDERAFDSFQKVLSYAGNSDFRRPGAFLAVIILSDEDDFSTTSGAWSNENYNNPDLVPVSSYKSFLDGLVGAGNHFVSSISIQDDACRDQLAGHPTNGAQKIGRRYAELAALTGGTVSSLCGDFGTSLALISDSIIQTSQSYQLSDDPVIGTIQVLINGNSLPEDAANGWTYEATTRVLTFHGSGIPPVGANIQITYETGKLSN